MPKIIGSSLAEHRARTRAALTTALARLMETRTFDAISLADIAAEAGVGRTAVYNHFPDKEALLLALVEDETAAYLARLREALVGVTDPVEQLRVYVRQQATLVHPYHPALRQAVSAEAVGRLREHATTVEQTLRGILRTGVATGVLPDQDVDVVVRLVHGCLAGRAVPEGPERERHVRAAEEFVLRAVGAALPARELQPAS